MSGDSRAPASPIGSTVAAGAKEVAGRSTASSRPARGGSGRLRGTGTLLRFMLRRDRVRLPAWVLGLTGLAAYFTVELGTVLGEPEALQSLVAVALSPLTALIGGPGYGYEDGVSVPRLLTGLYAVYLMLGAGIMSITTISRHARGEEESGRAELVRAGAVGRDAPLTAALAVATLMNVLVAGLVTLVLLAGTLDPAPEPTQAALFGASIGAAGLVVAGVAALTAQLSASARTCSGLAGAVLGLAFVVRGLGDMSFVQGGDLAWLSWLSPLGWSQQAAPFTLDRWWPLLLSLAATVVLVGLAYALQGRRDLGAGLVPERPGRRQAHSFLRGPVTLAVRLQRPGLLGWTAALAVAGVTFGAFAGLMEDGFEGMPPEILAMMGGDGEGGLAEGYVGFMGVYLVVLVAVHAILAVQTLRAEERSGRAETLLAAPVGRGTWLLAWTLVTAAGSLLLLLVAGLGVGVGAAVALGDDGIIASAVLGHTAHVAAAWCLLGVAVALHGLAPRLLPLTWVLYGAGVFLALFGPMMRLDDRVLDLSVFRHVGQYPGEGISWTGVAVLVTIAILAVLLGVWAFTRRDLRQG